MNIRYQPNQLLLFALGFLFTVCFAQTGKSQDQTIQEELKALFLQQTFPENPFENRKGIQHFRKVYEAAKKKKNEPDALNGARLNLGIQFSLLGNSDSAAWFFNQISDPRLSENKPEYKQFQAQIFGLLALSAFGQGRGTANSIRHLESALLFEPNNLKFLWLLNLSHMMQKTYPQGMAQTQVIDFKKFDGTRKMKTWPKIAKNSGLNIKGNMGGVIMEDFNDDGRIDIFATSMRLNQNVKFLIQDDKGKFTDITQKAGLNGVTGGSQAIQADFNNDLFPDILILRGGFIPDQFNQPNSLLRNNGDGTFTDVTRESGLLSYHPSQTACFADFNNDGKLDIFIGNEYDKENSLGDHYSELFMNNGGANFEEKAQQAGIKLNQFVKGVVAFDYDNDGWPDIYASCFSGSNQLFHNKGLDAKGNVQFEEVSGKAKVGQPIQSNPVSVLDINNDGWLDLVVAGYDLELKSAVADYKKKQAPGLHRPYVYLNDQKGSFREVGKEMNLNRSILAFGLNAADIDNDGFQDLFAATSGPGLEIMLPNSMLLNGGGTSFQEVGNATGFADYQKSNGSAFADLDGDGDLDLYLNRGGMYEGDTYANDLYLNPGSKFASLTLKFEGVKSNRSAIGVRVTIEVKDKDASRSIHRAVGQAGSYSGNSLALQIGLGKISSIEKVTVYWPASGTTQVFTDMHQGSAYFVKEDQKTHVQYSPERTEVK